jgi:hypothetical protein
MLLAASLTQFGAKSISAIGVQIREMAAMRGEIVEAKQLS